MLSALAMLMIMSSAGLTQPPDTLWNQTYGGSSDDRGLSVQQTTDGGYIVAGETNSFATDGYDVCLLKTDTNGDTLWARTYGTEGSQYGRSVQQTADGGYIVAGYTCPG
jgi:hypothetical protein